jgi:hypothetical protein
VAAAAASLAGICARRLRSLVGRDGRMVFEVEQKDASRE